MTEAAVAAEPPDVEQRARGRIIGVDLARGIALIGMAATHMLAVQNQDTGHLTTVGWIAAGRASALFAVLAGVSLALVTGGERPRRGRDRLRSSTSIAVRALLIGGIGLWLAGIGSPVAVILAYYAVLFVLSLPFLGLRTGTLAWLAVVWAFASPVLSHLWRQHLGEGLEDQASFVTLLDDPVATLRELVVLGYVPGLHLADLPAGGAGDRAVRPPVGGDSGPARRGRPGRRDGCVVRLRTAPGRGRREPRPSACPPSPPASAGGTWPAARAPERPPPGRGAGSRWRLRTPARRSTSSARRARRWPCSACAWSQCGSTGSAS